MGSSIAHDDGELRFSEGERVAGVEIVRELARGGMAIVYEARRFDGTAVALKVGTAEAARGETEARFRNEARLGAALHHPNIVRPLEVGHLTEPRGFEGRMYLITELVRGRSLADELMFHARGMPWQRVAQLATQLCGALVEMHRHGVVHRDLKPDNLLIGEGDTLHVIDFGLAYAVGEGATARSEDLTIDGAAPGTTLYMSPQQALHQPVAKAFDVYAVGVTLYELLSGRAPHAGRPDREVLALRSSKDETIPSLRKVARKTPLELVELVERCMAHAPSERPSAEELLAFFEQLTRAPTLELVSDGPEREAEVEPRTEGIGRRVAWAVIVLGVLGLVVSLRTAVQEAHALAPALAGLRVHLPQARVMPIPIEDAADPAPEPAPVPRSVPKSRPRKPHGRDARRKKAAPVPPPVSTPAPKPPSCESLRQSARSAHSRRSWAAVLDATADASCWSNAQGVRTRLRTEALMKLGRYKQCFKQAFGSEDRDVVDWGEACYRKIEGAKQ